MRKKNIVIYLLTPLLIEWMISFIVQLTAIFLINDVSNYVLEVTSVISLFTIPAVGWLYCRDQKRIEWKNGNKISVITIVSVVALGICACVGLNLLISISGIHRLSETYQEVSTSIYETSKWMQLVSVVLIAPIVEELIYRGLLYRRLREIAPVMPSVLISAFVFGITHGNLVQFVFATGIGILLAGAYEEYRKIGIPVLLHMSVNLTSLIITWINEIAL